MGDPSSSKEERKCQSELASANNNQKSNDSNEQATEPERKRTKAMVTTEEKLQKRRNARDSECNLHASAVGYVTVVIHGGLVTVVIHGEGSCNTGRQHQAEPPAYAQCPRLSFSFAFVVPVAMCIANAEYMIMGVSFVAFGEEMKYADAGLLCNI